MIDAFALKSDVWYDEKGQIHENHTRYEVAECTGILINLGRVLNFCRIRLPEEQCHKSWMEKKLEERHS